MDNLSLKFKAGDGRWEWGGRKGFKDWGASSKNLLKLTLFHPPSSSRSGVLRSHPLFRKRAEINVMFIGEYSHSIDDKGRLAIPAKFRALLKKGAVVTRGLDQCLFLYPIAEWKKLAEKLAALPLSQSNTRAFARLMLAGAMDVEIDPQGRIVLPEYLRAYAIVRKKVVLAGLYNRLEIWDDDLWTAYKQKTEKGSVDIAERLGELGV